VRAFCCGVVHVTEYMVLCIALGPGLFPRNYKKIEAFQEYIFRSSIVVDKKVFSYEGICCILYMFSVKFELF
jgi:hypothetical protein